MTGRKRRSVAASVCRSSATLGGAAAASLELKYLSHIEPYGPDQLPASLYLVVITDYACMNQLDQRLLAILIYRPAVFTHHTERGG